jgi:hypothetical protein
MGKALKLFEEKRQRSYPLPGDIKERILATADWDKNLEKKVRFGRVNFARALAYDVDLLETNSFNCGAEALRCLVAKAQKKLHVVSAIEASGTRSDFDQALSLVRRIVREESDSSTFRMIVDDLGALKVLRKVKFATNAALDIRRGSSKKSERIALRDVVDFVPCSGSEQCMSAR